MKMFALYDTVTRKYATCLEYPYFCRAKDWSVNAFEARKHVGRSSMKGAATRLQRRLELNVTMLKAGDWDGGGRHHDEMKAWGVECERRQADKLANFGIAIVELEDEGITPRILRLI